jgi:hypothetical protein
MPRSDDESSDGGDGYDTDKEALVSFHEALKAPGSGTLKQVCDWDESARVNNSWKCYWCPQRGNGITRLHAHVEKRHHRIKSVATALSLSVAHSSRRKEIAAASAASAAAAMGLSAAEAAQAAKKQRRLTDLGVVVGTDPKDEFTALLAMYAIEAAQPLSVVESAPMLRLLEGVLRFGREHPRASVEDVLWKRKKFSEIVATTSTKIVDDHFGGINFEIPRGVTLAIDGRSNVSQDPLLVLGFMIGGVFHPSGAVNAGSNKKSADYYKELLTDVCSGTHLLSRNVGVHVHATVQDNAAAGFKAARDVESSLDVIAIRDAPHSLGRVGARILAVPAIADVKAKAETVVTFVRGNPRVHSMVKAEKAMAMLRFVSTRFAYDAVVLSRLHRNMAALQRTVVAADFKAYVRGNPGIATVAASVKSIVDSDVFFERANAIAQMLLPVTLAIKETDKHHFPISAILMLYLTLAKRVALVAAEVAERRIFDPLTCAAVVEAVESSIESYLCPVHYAAWALSIRNRDKYRALAHSNVDGERELHTKITTALRDVSAMVARRHFRDAENIDDIVARVRYEVATYQLQSPNLDAIPREDLDRFVPEALWETYGGSGLLKTIAIIILTMGCSASNIERLHKLYSLIHTPTRNSLTDATVDKLTLASYVRRAQEFVPESVSTRNEGRLLEELLQKLENFSVEDEEALRAWGETVIAAKRQTRASINHSVTDGPLLAAPPAPRFTAALVGSDEEDGDDDADYENSVDDDDEDAAAPVVDDAEGNAEGLTIASTSSSSAPPRRTTRVSVMTARLVDGAEGYQRLHRAGVFQ